jgi:hypothetical protein
LKFGADYNALDHLSGELPLHFGGRYIFSGLPAIPGVLPAPINSIQALALGLPAAYVQGYGNPNGKYIVHDVSLFAQEDWEAASNLVVKVGLRYQGQFWPDVQYDVPKAGSYTFPDTHNVGPRLAAAWTPVKNHALSVHGAYGMFYENHLTSLPGVTDIIDGTAGGVRTLVLRFPESLAGWNAPGHKRPASPTDSFPSLALTIDPGLKTPFTHQLTTGIAQPIGNNMTVSADVTMVRGHHFVGTIDYNPITPAAGANRRPEDAIVNGVAVPFTSASILQYTTFGESWYRGLAVSLERRLHNRAQWLVSYTWSKAEDTSTDYQNAFLPQDTGRGRNPDDPTGLPLDFDPAKERGPTVQDQRHRFVASGLVVLPADIHLSSLVAIGSGRPYNILAGSDLNGDGDGGAFPTDRARRVPTDPSSSVMRNSGLLPMTASVDLRVSRAFTRNKWSAEGILEVFNLFNRTNFTDINNIFGAGAYPSNPSPTFGQFEKAGPPRQVQIGVRVRR